MPGDKGRLRNAVAGLPSLALPCLLRLVMVESEPASSTWAEKSVPLLLGAASFWAMTGGRVLNGRNIAWMQEGDPAQYFLGWQFFRMTPWGFPLGANPRFGMEIGSGLAYTDNVPSSP